MPKKDVVLGEKLLPTSDLQQRYGEPGINALCQALIPRTITLHTSPTMKHECEGGMNEACASNGFFEGNQNFSTTL